jgi:hypothetical protein
VQTRNSKKGRPRKVINQGKAKISFTGKAVTSHAGIALISRALEHFSVRENLKVHPANAGVQEQ